jgi:NAD(P)H-hydrate epimerase
VSEELRSLVPPPLADEAHKGQAGRVLVLAGSRTMPGAAVLVARGAARGGAGLVSVGCFDAALMTILPITVPEAVLVDLSRPSDLPAALAANEYHAVVAGPGTGRGGRGAELARALLQAGLELPLVLDADALTNLAGDLAALRAHRGPLVITPHPGEARALLGREVPGDGRGRVAAARELARGSGAICCLKGAGTVVTDGERVYVNDTGNAGMATGGTGDVLAGILAAYLAHPALRAGDPAWSALDAACAAVRVHGLAGDLAAAHLGRRALIASDLVAWLGSAQKRLEA